MPEDPTKDFARQAMVEFNEEGLHDYEVPASCQFIVAANVNKLTYQKKPNSLFVTFKNGYLASFKSNDVAERMTGDLAEELSKVAGVSRAGIEDREVYYIEFKPGSDINELLKAIDDKVIELSKWEKMPE